MYIHIHDNNITEMDVVDDNDKKSMISNRVTDNTRLKVFWMLHLPETYNFVSVLSKTCKYVHFQPNSC